MEKLPVKKKKKTSPWETSLFSCSVAMSLAIFVEPLDGLERVNGCLGSTTTGLLTLKTIKALKSFFFFFAVALLQV